MRMLAQNRDLDEKIELLRGGMVVTTLTGAFGQSLRETRLTAMLGYLIALRPREFLDLFGFKGDPQTVYLEMRHEEGRSDILVETNIGLGVIEAKVDATDPLLQSARYPARWVALLTHYKGRKTSSRVRYINWQELADVLENVSQSGSERSKLISDDLLVYMRRHNMVRDRSSVEIYAREINEPTTLELFLKAQLYGCNYERGSRLGEALYFSPHFGKSISNEQPGIGVGISYVARIESVGSTTTWDEFRSLMKDERGGIWWNRHREILKKLHRKWQWNKETHRSILLLAEPRLVFNPPIRKESLQKGKGWLSKRFFSFDDLFSAWGRR